mmetsp:Transcript_23389/g.79573  ORF Transcript_23389/g.79573 Transcript_23389/m.79573 type:complete len:509 (-) Transcript_23389:1108-2634(-)|eukprot:CAMPEP_0183789108 /NCGR_PEP_ID=MMETSP0803_2-20130417/206_1 /TAXON_ID=195967 /ORGANISM="Crustomastix stigmata, Strain CCMP3273" /LENGTH=508 /DNA_ID=CAMNT_0026033269 /DNA_START=549 /DNA_END=2075 /DNA_ORIENTATION=-
MPSISITLCFIPRRTSACEQALQEEGVYGELLITECSVGMVMCASDVLTLELPHTVRDLLCYQDDSPKYYVFQALQQIQRSAGYFTHIYGKGKASLQVAQMLSRARKGNSSDQARSSENKPGIDVLLMLDREVDMITPTCTQLTYEGLIDEVLKLHNNTVEIPNDNGSTTRKKLIQQGDSLFNELRDLNFAQVCDTLFEKSTSMQSNYLALRDKEFHETDVAEFRNFVRTLRTNMGGGVDLHATVAQALLRKTKTKKFLDLLAAERDCVEGQAIDACFELLQDLHGKGQPLQTSLRLGSLISLTNGGIPRKYHSCMRTEVLHLYGFETLLSFECLENSGLMKRNETSLLQPHRSIFGALKKSLQLVVEEPVEGAVSDIHFAFSSSGYAPLSVRIVQHLLETSTSKSAEDILRLVPGPGFEYHFSPEGRAFCPPLHSKLAVDPLPRRLIVVCLIGGITYAELAALRFWAKQDNHKFDILILTTQIITGARVLGEVLDKIVHDRFETVSA